MSFKVSAIVRMGLWCGICVSLLSCQAVAPSGYLSEGVQRQQGDPVKFFIGQASPDLTDFKTEVLDVDPSFPRPDGFSLYTNVDPNLCQGLTASCNQNGNIWDYPTTLMEYPDIALNVGLYLSDRFSVDTQCENRPLRALLGRNDLDLANGVGDEYRRLLDELIVYLRDLNRDVYLRIGYEFDGPWNCYNTDFYIEAFRYVKGRIDALKATRVLTVWHSATYPIDGDANFNYDFSNPMHLDVWYPGDEFVDVVGISTFAWDNSYLTRQFACLQTSIAPETLYNRATDFATTHNKPVMIVESTPAAYRTRQLDSGCVGNNLGPDAITADELWTEWYEPFFGFINNNLRVEAFAYINSDWEAVAQFNCAAGATGGDANCTDGYWGNSRIQDNDVILSRFAEQVRALQSPPPPSNATMP